MVETHASLYAQRAKLILSKAQTKMALPSLILLMQDCSLMQDCISGVLQK